MPDLQISWRFSKKTRSAERRSEGERGEAGAGHVSMPQFAGAGSGHDNAPIRVAHGLRATNKIVHVQAQRDSHTQKVGMGKLHAPMHAGDGWWVHRKRKLWALEGARSRLSKQKLSQK